MRTIKIKPLFAAFLLIALPLTAQDTTKPFYFPHKTGDMWEYFWEEEGNQDTLQNFCINDSIDSQGRLIVTQIARFINPIKLPSNLEDTTVYVIDSSYNVFGRSGEWSNVLVYKLNAQQGDQWVMVDGFGHYEMCRVSEVWDGFLFGIPTVFKRFVYYGTADSSDTLGLVRYGDILAHGFGLYARGGGETFGDIFLKGASIDKILYGDTTAIITSVKNSNNIPFHFELYQNYPNPFNSSTSIIMEINITETVSLIIYDVVGREVRRLIDSESLQFGKYKVVWDGRTNQKEFATSGIYFYKLLFAGYSVTKSMILLK
jgi:hypothetical protein